MDDNKKNKIDNRKSLKIDEETHNILIKYCNDNQLHIKKFVEHIIREKCSINI